VQGEFEGRLAIVTGAAQGIGEALSKELATLGARVVMVDVNKTRLISAANALCDERGRTHPHVCDLGVDEDVEQLGQAVLDEYGVPDMVFNNAYIPMLGGVDDIVMDDWRLAFNVNVFGYVRMVKAFAAAMMERGSGHIMNSASPMGIMPDLFGAGSMIPYCSSKAADIGLSSALAAALHPHGINVSVFFPDITDTWTNQVRGAVSSEFTLRLGRMIQERGATPQSAARAMLDGMRSGKYLVSAEPGFEERLVRGAMAGFDPRATDRALDAG
jgi:NAD(P)-dependent dehydrogenase (short-subunit alcohol dehydrogenase family)